MKIKQKILLLLFAVPGLAWLAFGFLAFFINSNRLVSFSILLNAACLLFFAWNVKKRFPGFYYGSLAYVAANTVSGLAGRWNWLAVSILATNLLTLTFLIINKNYFSEKPAIAE